MRIDHTPAQPVVPHVPGTHVSVLGEVPGTGKHALPKDISYRLLQAESQDPASTDREMSPLRIGSKVDGFERKGQAWFVATELQSDLLVEVGDISFHLHKFPLLSRSGKLNRLVFDSRDIENGHIKLNEMPGGPETFELAAKFCYGVAVELTSGNVAALRCAAEYLEMTEVLDEGNLVSKTEAFLSFVVLASWKDSVTVLHSCEKLLPWADQLQIVRRCCESIAWKACTDPRGIRWSFTERTEVKKANLNHHSSPLWSGIGPKSHASSATSRISDQVPSDWWLEDICVVCVSFFTKILQAIKVKGMKCELLGSAIVHYAIKWLPGLTKDFVVVGTEKEASPRKELMVDESFLSFGGHPPHPSGAKDEKIKAMDLGAVQSKYRELIETLAAVLPTQKDAVPCTFLLRLLRLGKMVHVNPSTITDLEKRAGMQLDQGTLSDLLIPSFDRSCETLYDVDLVQRMLDCFLLQDFVPSPGSLADPESDNLVAHPPHPPLDGSHGTPQSTYSAKTRVAKLIDNYLAEVGRDQNLSLSKFLSLAEALPEHTRATDDGLYKSIDTYLKAHPVLSENDRKKICRTLDCQRLSLDACMHAAQNERLPLRVVVQVLFGEQIKLRNAVTGTSSLSKDHSGPYLTEEDQISVDGSSHSSVHDHCDNSEQSEEEINVLRSDVERMKGKFMALQHDYTAIQQQLEKLTKHPKHPAGSVWKKLFPHVHLPHPHLPHPHFHVPHFLAHPLDIFHHKDHHHDKDHHHHHDKEHRQKHHHGKGHEDSHHHSKEHEPAYNRGRQSEKNEESIKDHHHHHSKKYDSHNGQKDHHASHQVKDSHHHHGHAKQHDSHHHHSSKDHSTHQHHSKDHDAHHHTSSKDHDSRHLHSSKDNDSHHHHSSKNDSSHQHHSTKDHDSHRKHSSKDHDAHHKHSSKDHDSLHKHSTKGYDSHHLHSSKGHDPHHQSSHHDHSSKDHNSHKHLPKQHDSHHHHLYRDSKEHDTHHRDVKEVNSHHSNDTLRSSQSKEYPSDAYYFSYSKDSDHILTSHAHLPKDHHAHAATSKDLPPAHHSNPSVGNRNNHSSGNHSITKFVEPRHSKDGESHHSGCHPESGEDSSKSLEGPATPTHSGEPHHHKKHTRPFANAIRKWRNSIS